MIHIVVLILNSFSKSSVQFLKCWDLKYKNFGQESTYSKGKEIRILLMNVSLSKIGHDFSNKVVQKLTLKKMFLTKNGLLNRFHQ